MTGEKGQALPLAMIALTIGALIIAPFLGHAGTSLISSRTYASIIAARNAADAGVEHAIWSLTRGTLPAQIPTSGNHITYQLGEMLNGLNTSVTVTTNATGGGASGNITSAVIDSLVFDTTAGYSPDIIQVSSNVCAIVYQGASSDGYLKTVTIDASGNIGNSAIDTLNFDTSSCYEPDIVYVSGNYFAIAYRSSTNIGYLKTVTITSSGDIGNSVISSLTIAPFSCYTPSIIPVAGTYFAITYQGYSNWGYLKTVSINSSGIISGTVVSTLNFDTTASYEPYIMHTTGTYYAIAYRGASNRGYLETVSISSSGIINGTIVSTLIFDTTACYEPNMVFVTGNYYAIAYRGSANGTIKTVSINSSGVIGSSVISSLVFDAATSYLPDIVQVTSNAFAIAYGNSANKGYLKEVSIAANGTITSMASGTLNFDAVAGYEPSIVYFSGNIFALAYRGSGTDGYVVTISMNSSGITVYRIDATAGSTTITAFVNTNNTTAAIMSWQIR
jgi:hypothetical protein